MPIEVDALVSVGPRNDDLYQTLSIAGATVNVVAKSLLKAKFDEIIGQVRGLAVQYDAASGHDDKVDRP